MYLNKFLGIGRLTRDPESRQAGSTSVVKFGIAINRRFKKGDEWQDEPLFIDCEAWDTGAERIQNDFVKGDRILIEGELRQDHWEDKATGQKRSKTYVRVTRFQSFAHLMRQNDAATDEAPKAKPTKGKKAADVEDSDPVPF